MEIYESRQESSQNCDKISRQDMIQRTGISSGHDNKIRSEGAKNDQQEINMRIVGIKDELMRHLD